MRIFSGIRPTGELHIGNYLGAIKQWIELQENNDCIFCVVDLHAITTPYDPKLLQKNIFDLAVTYLAAGLEPEKCIFFVQSHVKEHTELNWLLGAITSLGDLQRMTQFKEKAKKHPEYVNAGLLNYPILMAADILLYKTECVPVGKDQRQHVELAREIARRFNKKFGQVFQIPNAVTPKMGAKIMSLQNPKKKMSKTDSPKDYIGVFEEPESIKNKIMSAVTDTGKKIEYSPAKKPGISNLLTIYSLFAGDTIKIVEKRFADKSYAEFKKQLALLLIEKLDVFRKKRKEFSSREVYVQEILERGKNRAQTIAQSTIQDVKTKMGLLQE